MATAKTKKRTSRDVYAELRAKHAETLVDRLNQVLATPLADGELTFDFVSPSGMEWKLRKLNISVFVNAGLLPQALAMKMAVLTKEGGAEVMRNITSKELNQTIEFNSSVIRYVCVEPRIVETPENDDDIAFDDVLQIDYDALLKWSNGEVEAEKLETFRRKRQ